MKVTVVIPAYNEEQYIGACLASVIANGANIHEIIVVNNASSDNTESVAKSYPGARVITEERKGVTRARQRGIDEATGDIIAFIDADTIMPKGWIDDVVRSFQNRPAMVCMSGPYRYYDSTRSQDILLRAFWWASAPLTYMLVGYMVLGGNFAARRSALAAIGGFDTTIDFYGDDTDIARRLHTQGKVLWRMNFNIHTSVRRFEGEGLLRTNIRYALNFISVALLNRPFTKKYNDIRIGSKNINK
jgi:glycosyltransferase involved in cell wall biosynthesis